MEVHIRRYRRKDVPQLARCFLGLQEQTVAIDQCKFYRAGEDFDAEKYTKSFVRNIASSGQVVFVAEAEGELVGHMVLAVETMKGKERLEFYCRRRGRIIELFIKPAFRSAGIGSKMMEKAEQYFKQQHCDWIGVQAIHINDGALQFYRKHGYKEHAVELLKKLERLS